MWNLPTRSIRFIIKHTALLLHSNFEIISLGDGLSSFIKDDFFHVPQTAKTVEKHWRGEWHHLEITCGRCGEHCMSERATTLNKKIHQLSVNTRPKNNSQHPLSIGQRSPKQESAGNWRKIKWAPIAGTWAHLSHLHFNWTHWKKCMWKYLVYYLVCSVPYSQVRSKEPSLCSIHRTCWTLGRRMVEEQSWEIAVR